MSSFFHCWTFKLFPFFQYYKWLCSKHPVLGHPSLLVLTPSLPVWRESRHCHFSSWNILSLTLSYRNHFMVPSEEVGLLPGLPNFWLALSKLHSVFPPHLKQMFSSAFHSFYSDFLPTTERFLLAFGLYWLIVNWSGDFLPCFLMCINLNQILHMWFYVYGITSNLVFIVLHICLLVLFIFLVNISSLWKINVEKYEDGNKNHMVSPSG